MSGQTPAETPPTEQLPAPQRRRAGTIATGIAIAIAVVLLVVGIGAGYYIYPAVNKSSSTATIVLSETGSSLLYPLFKYYWAPNYTAPNVIVSAASSGSGTGQSDAETGLVNIGASDPYLKNASQTNLINVPVAISAQLVYYNLPAPLNGIHLNLNGSVLAMIYEGNITTWDNPLILGAQNSTVQTDLKGLASQTIYVVKRSDSSGDTNLFSTLCWESWSGFTYTPGNTAFSSLTGTDVLTGTGNSGIVTTLKGQVGAIGYVGISYESSAAAAGLEYAALGDNLSLSALGGTSASNYVLPSASTISQDANLGLARLNYPEYGLAVNLIMGGSYLGAINITHGGGGSNPTVASPTPYPDTNLEYTLIKTVPTGTTVTSAALAATVAFEKWALSYGNFNPTGGPSVWIQAVNFVPLTPEVIGLDMETLASVQT